MGIEKFDIEKGYAVFSKGRYSTGRHAHYAIEIVVSGEGCFSITTDEKKYENISGAIIPSNIPHSFSCVGSECDLLFVDPISESGRYIDRKFLLPSNNQILIQPDLTGFYENGSFNLTIPDQTAFSSDIDHRIAKCLHAIESLATNNKLTLAELAKLSFLSESRLAHLFKQQLGISVHQCILWKKILLATAKSIEGYSITECAHYVGFADSSHFNKAFGKMFGINPFFVLKS
ncbi:MAG: helix-turn-helix transcriptional regulator [Chitinophagaceae bacterium]|nr:helix-turn-helix transcriptional regulator [Chitinophagaceae bacterium]